MRRKTIIILLVVLAMFAVGFRDRYGPTFWRFVTGGIEYTGGNVNITNGTLSVSSINIVSYENAAVFYENEIVTY